MAKKQASRRKASAKKKRRAPAKRAATKRKSATKGSSKTTSKSRRGTKKIVAKKSPRRATTAMRGASRARIASNSSRDFGIPTASAVRRVRRGEDVFRTHESHRELRSGASDVPRDAGVGAPDDGPGSHSGGDVSPDFVGVGTGGSGIAESGAGGHTRGPALSNAGDFASGPPARGHNNLPPGLVGGNKRVDGSVVMPVEDPNTNP